MKFTKMEGCANDFVVIDAADGPWTLDTARSRAICDRRRGVGADGVLVIGAPRVRGERRWPVEVHNADGSIAEACGNGLRCVARLLLDRNGGEWVELITRAGLVRAWRAPEGIAVALDIPQIGDAFAVSLDHRRIAGARVRAGNSTLVLVVPDPAHEDLPRLAARARSEAGPGNVVLCAIGGDRLVLRVDERGVGETQACGSGACAAVALAAERTTLGASVRVQLAGGTLVVHREPTRYVLAGPADYVFEGTL